MIKLETIQPVLQQNKQENRISFVLFGKDQHYTLGAFHNLVLAKKIYPNWICRIYTDKIDHSCNFFEEMGAEVFRVVSPIPPVLWRLYCIDDDRCKYIIFRDVDALLSMREKYAVDEWTQSKKIFHRMKESYHTQELPILGGMWGIDSVAWRAKFGSIRKMLHKINWKYDPRLEHQSTPNHRRPKLDENFLYNQIWEIARQDCCFHGVSDAYGQAIPFKCQFEANNHFKKESCDFVGSRIYHYNFCNTAQ